VNPGAALYLACAAVLLIIGIGAGANGYPALCGFEAVSCGLFLYRGLS